MWSRLVTFSLLMTLWRRNGLGRGLRTAQEGQSMVEYSIVAALIAIVAMAAVQALGGGVANVFTNILPRISGIGS